MFSHAVCAHRYVHWPKQFKTAWETNLHICWRFGGVHTSIGWAEDMQENMTDRQKNKWTNNCLFDIRMRNFNFLPYTQILHNFECLYLFRWPLKLFYFMTFNPWVIPGWPRVSSGWPRVTTGWPRATHSYPSITWNQLMIPCWATFIFFTAPKFWPNSDCLWWSRWP